MKKIIRRGAVLIGTAGMIAAGLFAGVAPASAASWHTGTDPATTGCASGSYQVTAVAMRDQYITGAPQVGAVQLMYSPNCGTNWVNVYGYSSGYRYQGYIRSGSFENGVTAYGANSAEHTLQVYAPGSTCVSMDHYAYRNSDNRLVSGQSNQYC